MIIPFTFCPKCQKSIKVIPSIRQDQVFVCEKELMEFVSENGRKIKGYPLHQCEEEGEKE